MKRNSYLFIWKQSRDFHNEWYNILNKMCASGTQTSSVIFVQRLYYTAEQLKPKPNDTLMGWSKTVWHEESITMYNAYKDF